MHDEAAPGAEDARDDEDRQAQQAHAGRDGARDPVQIDCQQRPTGNRAEVRQLPRHSYRSHRDERSEDNRDHRERESFEPVEAQEMKVAHTARSQQRDVLLSALNHVRDHHGEVVEHGHHHEGQQKDQREAGEEAPPLEVGQQLPESCQRHRPRKQPGRLGVDASEPPACIGYGPLFQHVLVEKQEPGGLHQRGRIGSADDVHHDGARDE